MLTANHLGDSLVVVLLKTHVCVYLQICSKVAKDCLVPTGIVIIVLEWRPDTCIPARSVSPLVTPFSTVLWFFKIDRQCTLQYD